MDYKEEIKRQIPSDIPASYLAGGEPLFYAFECVLLQTENHNSYTFTVVNINDGRKCVISRRKNPLYAGEDIKFAEKIWQSSIAGARLLEIEKPFGEKIDFEKCEKTLKLIFRELLENQSLRVKQEQIAMASHILNAMHNRCSTLVESETGTTLAYLVASIIILRGRVNDFWNTGFYPDMQYVDYAKLPIVIATSNISLQKAILTEYIPQISKIMLHHGIIKKPITAAFSQSKKNIICDKRLAAQIKFENDPAIKEQLEQLQYTVEIDLSEIPELPQHIKNKICVAGRCGASTCSRYTYCRYISKLEKIRSNEFDIQICTHSYLLADSLRRVEGKRALIPNFQLVVINEADSYISASRLLYTSKFSDNELPDIIDSVKRLVYINPETEAKALSFLNILEDKNNRLFRNPNKNVVSPEYVDDTKNLTVTIDSDSARHLRKIREIITSLTELLELKPIKSESAIHLSKITGNISTLLKKVSELARVSKNIYWYEQTETKNILCSIPKDLGEKLFENQWSNGVPTIFVSGKLSTSDDFSNIKSRLGLGKIGSKLTEYRK